MKVALFPHDKKKDSLEIGKSIAKFFQERKMEVFIDRNLAKDFTLPPYEMGIGADFFIALGGDGKILQLIHEYSELNIPILGINLGSLGFMADIPLSELFSSLEDLINKKYKIEKRIALEVMREAKTIIAGNDIVIHRTENPRLIELSVSIDKSFLNTFSSDGLIFATPNGSTAYSLSAGGPILAPWLQALVITPICPHTISNRPFVIDANGKIEVKNLSQEKAQVFLDGINSFSLEAGNSLIIKKSEKTIQLVKLAKHDYFTTLRNKLNWSGKFIR